MRRWSPFNALNPTKLTKEFRHEIHSFVIVEDDLALKSSEPHFDQKLGRCLRFLIWHTDDLIPLDKLITDFI